MQVAKYERTENEALSEHEKKKKLKRGGGHSSSLEDNKDEVLPKGFVWASV